MEFDMYGNRPSNLRRMLPWAISGVLALVVVGLLYTIWHVGRQNSIMRFENATTTGMNTLPDAHTSAAWRTYTDETYHFSMSYPSDWTVVSGRRVDTPMITFYKTPAPVGIKPPFDHFAEATHVSVYPHGIPTEGVSSMTRSTQVETQETIKQGNDFLLKDGTPWATMLTFTDPPSGWNEGGFIWANVMIDMLDTTCDRGGQFVPFEQCDVLTGDVYVRKGTVDPELRATELVMLKTFTFTQKAANKPKSDVSNLIRVTAPKSNAAVSSPLHLTGEARGTWYFEASFPARVEDGNGTILWQGPVQAHGEWMTENFVPFSIDIVYKQPATPTGTLILENDNPSGLPENHKELRIPLTFQ